MDYIQPLIIGLLGSFHCLGMCGPIAVSLPLREKSLETKVFSSLLYNLGRVTTYSFLGLIFGLLGLGLHIWGIQQWASIAVGTIMILSVGFPILFHGGKITTIFDGLLMGFKKYFGRFFGFRTYTSIWMIGILNGFLPCGLVYVALAGALLSTTPWNGAFYMIIFGIGTVPSLLVLSLLGNFFTAAIRRRMKGSVPFLILIVGILFVLRGMNLGIPYLSPKMEASQKTKTEQFQKPKCCE
ncbi:MAG: sulfite exporter TauE/SafE family protein [Bacteroidetes bacterium]|nr:sulfite exporter TauE/SafE family protein [Bacteroidota bacterium]